MAGLWPVAISTECFFGRIADQCLVKIGSEDIAPAKPGARGNDQDGGRAKTSGKPRDIERSLRRLDVITAGGKDLRLGPEGEWANKHDTACCDTLVFCGRQIVHRSARLAAAIASEALEYRKPFHS